MKFGYLMYLLGMVIAVLSYSKTAILYTYFDMERKHEREGIVTLSEHNIMPVDSVVLPDEYQVGSNYLSIIIG